MGDQKVEIRKYIRDLENEIADIDLEIKALIDRKRDKQVRISESQCVLEEIEADEFRQAHGKDKPFADIGCSELPLNICEEWDAIRDQLRNGCHGDPQDGCRGCEEDCERRAKKIFEQKYNIHVTYGKN